MKHVALALLLVTTGCASGGWTEYRDTLRDAYGMAPYRNPVGGWGPGTLLRLGAREDDAPSLRFTAGDIFTGARADVFADPQALGDTQASRISKIRFAAAADSEDDGNILPADLSASFDFVLTEDTSVTWSASGAELHALKEGRVEIALGRLDPANPVDDQFIDDLLDERMVLLSAVLYVKSAEFTFETQQVIGADLRTRIQQEAAKLEAQVEFDGDDQRRFKLSTANPLYFAYTTYPIDRAKLQARYEEKRRLRVERDLLASRTAALEEEAGRLEGEQLAWDASRLTLERRVKELDDRPRDHTEHESQDLEAARRELEEVLARRVDHGARLQAIRQELQAAQAAATAATERLEVLEDLPYDRDAP